MRKYVEKAKVKHLLFVTSVIYLFIYLFFFEVIKYVLTLEMHSTKHNQ